MGRRISKEFLHPSILEGVNDKIGNLDSLETDAKGNMVQAINELVEKLDNSAEIENGKELIANAVGEPLTAEESFDEMSNDINGLLSQFKTNMMNNGVTVESGDRFKALIDKIATIADNEGKGVQIANGITKTALSSKSFSHAAESKTSSYSYIEIRNLTFTPQIILAFVKYGVNSNSVFTIYNTFSMYPERVYLFSGHPDGLAGGSVQATIHANSCNIDSTGFMIPINTYNTTSEDCYWVAIGVGEEDTTLRDSLADILENKGVDVTEEDDMASLINKVDEEFNNSKRIVTGTITPSNIIELTTSAPYIINTNLDFVPSRIIVTFTKYFGADSNSECISLDSLYATSSNSPMKINSYDHTYDYQFTIYYWISDITAESFKIYGNSGSNHAFGDHRAKIFNYPLTWIAIE